MTFYEWALQNPMSLAGYKSLQKQLNNHNEQIAGLEQQIVDAQRNIAPARLNPFGDVLSDAFELRSPFESDDQFEGRVIQRKKDRHKFTLDVAVTSAKAMLEGRPSGDWITKGLYEQRQETLDAIRDFNPATDVTDWHTHPSKIPDALDERLIALGWDRHQDDFTQLFTDIEELADWIDEWGCFDTFGFALTLRRFRWVAQVHDDVSSFTRVDEDLPIKAFQRALITYLDARWDFLIIKFKVASEVA